MLGGPIVSKPIIPPGKRHWIAVAWLWPTGGSRIVFQPYPRPPTREPAPTAHACCWARGGQKQVDEAWQHMASFEPDENVRWAVYTAATQAELFGPQEQTLVKVRERILNDWEAS